MRSIKALLAEMIGSSRESPSIIIGFNVSSNIVEYSGCHDCLVALCGSFVRFCCVILLCDFVV